MDRNSGKSDAKHRTSLASDEDNKGAAHPLRLTGSYNEKLN